jgi:RND superfamily putative drug exporter
LFELLGRLVTRWQVLVALAWAALLAVMLCVAPTIESVQNSDDTVALPPNVPSHRAAELLHEKFDRPFAQAVAAIVIERPTGLTGLPRDAVVSPLFVGASQPETVSPRPMLDTAQPAHSAATSPTTRPAKSDDDWSYLVRLADQIQEHGRPLHWDIRSPTDPALFPILVSRDRQAAVLRIALPDSFVSVNSVASVDWLQEQLAKAQPPPGLRCTVTGSAGYGRDYAAAARESLGRTTIVTIVAVLVILLLTYRALLAAALSLAAVAVSVIVTLSILAIGGQHGWSVSTIVELFAIVIGFGAGIDFSLFFLSRFHEELARQPEPVDRAASRRAAVAALAGTGPAILASAGTVAAGLALMAMAQFRTFSTAGPTVSISVVVACLASLTLTPALASLIGPATFWPRRKPQVDPHARRVAVWDRIAWWTVGRPVSILLIGLAVLIPLAFFGWLQPIVYDTLADLPRDNASVVGGEMFARHFPPGEMAPATLLIKLDAPCDDAAWVRLATAVDAALLHQPLVDQVRSAAHPLGRAGIEFTADDLAAAEPGLLARVGRIVRRDILKGDFVKGDIFRARVARVYLSPTRITAQWQIALKAQPYTVPAMDALGPIKDAVEQAAKASGAKLSQDGVLIAGDTAQMRDLCKVTDRDFMVVGLLAVAAIVLIVTLLVREFLVAAFVMVATVLTYGAALALTGWIFQFATGIPGIDWKVMFFLFVILVAVGQDYNLFMLTRIIEERRTQPLNIATGLAIGQTGAIISSCGLIMAATLGSLASSPLRLLHQLGVAFILGLLIDTFLVRPLLVPAFVLATKRFSRNRTVRK